MRRHLDSVWLQAYYTYRALFTWLTWPSYVSNVIVRPAMQVLLFYLMGRFAAGDAGAQRFVIGMIAYNSPLIVTAGVSQSLVFERNLGTLPFLFVSPVGRLENLLARGLFHVPNGLLGACIGLVALVLLGFPLGAVAWWGVGAGIVLVTLSSITYSLLFTGLGMVVRDWSTIYGISIAIMLLLTGTLVPIAVLPPPLQWLAQVLPVTHGLEAIRASFAGAAPATIAAGLLEELVVALGYAIVAYALVRVLETASRRRGSFEMVDV